jgi:uncharacterized protein YbjT (DUF2867 family)
VTRDPARARVDPRAEVVAADLEVPESLPSLFDDVDRVFLLSSGHGGDGLAQERAALAAAARAGVSHVVKLSTTGVHFGQQDGISLLHAEAEKAVREAGPAWTILRPTTFMDNRYAWLKSVVAEDTVYITAGEADSAMVHGRDIAEVAALVLTTDGHEGRTYELTGGEALSSRRQVEILAEALGRPLNYVEESEAATRDRMLGFGWPASSIDGMFTLKRESAEHEKVVFGTVERLLGRAPLTFADWARQKAPAFSR